MLSKQKRIPRKLFKSIIEGGKYFNSPHFALKAVKTAEQARIAVSVSKKVSKKAVIRNRTRRRAYSALQNVDLPNGLYLISAKSGAENLKGEALKKELEGIISKL